MCLSAEPGTYALVLHADTGTEIGVGRLGVLRFAAGYYAYVGSAFGPGGVKARVGRHHRTHKPKRWHIDYLTACLRPVEVWYTHEPVRREHAWARAMARLGAEPTVAGFGSSDCSCHTHLFYTTARPKLSRFRSLAMGRADHLSGDGIRMIDSGALGDD